MYSDIQMIIASQIAYLNVEEDFTVKEILDIAKNSSDPSQVKKAEKLETRINELPPEQREACENWIVRDVRDDQLGSGMYACMLETGEGEALIAFRGSESYNMGQTVRDWVASDIGLLNSVITPQQYAAQQYVRDIYNEYGSQYDSFAMTGHSLGGNLAMHGTITAPDGMRDQIIQCNNLDGPGFSDEYIAAHRSDIGKSSHVITHNQWSWVGSLLTPVPGADHRIVDAETPEDKGDSIKDKGIVWRHDTYNVTNFDENGNMVPAKEDWLSEKLGPITKGIDYVLTSVLNFLGITFAYNLADQIWDNIENLWEDWQRARAAGKHVEFEMTPQSLSGGLEQASAIFSGMDNACQNIDQVQSQLAFDSIVSVYVKAKLWRLSNSIENSSRKLQNYCDKGNTCSQIYKKYDNKASGYY